jgi:hypothetical protein
MEVDGVCKWQDHGLIERRSVIGNRWSVQPIFVTPSHKKNRAGIYPALSVRHDHTLFLA